mmetsp:Transcript_2982/g.3517  ORF Transcript_2982/g.3517 Transcript_2982/m.3517 type:complete len:421 (+) Transcript_2982:57-1319(+)
MWSSTAVCTLLFVLPFPCQALKLNTPPSIFHLNTSGFNGNNLDNKRVCWNYGTRHSLHMSKRGGNHKNDWHKRLGFLLKRKYKSGLGFLWKWKYKNGQLQYRASRRYRRRRSVFPRLSTLQFPPQNLQNSLVYTNILVFILQILSALFHVPTLNAHLVLSGCDKVSRWEILFKYLFGSTPITMYGLSSIASSYGPFMMDFAHQKRISKMQPHRYLTSGFLHSGIIHLIINMKYLFSLPSWIECELGRNLYITTFLLSTIMGNLFQSNGASAAMCLGASGGICGLNGLMYVVLTKAGESNKANKIIQSMLILLFYGVLDKNVGNACHVGGFIAGAIVGLIFGPNFRRAYVSPRRTPWQDMYADQITLNPSIRQSPSKLPLSYLQLVLLVYCMSQSALRQIPSQIAQGLLSPGSLSGVANLL